VRANTIFSWKMKDTPVAYLTPSGYTDTAFRNGENGSNGLALDKDGNLLLCQSGNRQVVRMNAPLDSPKPSFTILAPNYNGKKFNSPNDLVADSRNNIYFTDPIYGLPQHENDPTRELNFEGVYKISADGKVSLLIDSIKRPNGIAFSLDEKILYIGSTDEKNSGWYAYHVDANGDIASGGILLDATAMKEKAKIKQGGDGFKIDKYGNLFASGPDGINIISPEGKLLGLIAPVSSIQVDVPSATFVLTQTWPPEGIVGMSGPKPSVPAYITLENPLPSSGPPMASARTRLVSAPVQMPEPPVSKLLLRTVNPAPVFDPRHMRQVPTINSLELCGSRRNDG